MAKPHTREPSGRKRRKPAREQRLGPTPERLAHALRLLRGASARCGQPLGVEATEGPLALLAATGDITADEERACQRYAWAYRHRHGSGHAGSYWRMMVAGHSGPPPTPEETPEDRAAAAICRAAEEVLSDVPRAHRDAFVNLVVYHRWPRWLYTVVCAVESPKHRDYRAYSAFRAVAKQIVDSAAERA